MSEEKEKYWKEGVAPNMDPDKAKILMGALIENWDEFIKTGEYLNDKRNQKGKKN
jgi:hypothetical protein